VAESERWLTQPDGIRHRNFEREYLSAKPGMQSTAIAALEGAGERINQNRIDFGTNPIGSAVYAEFGVARAGDRG
jgi:hypothetical protein